MEIEQERNGSAYHVDDAEVDSDADDEMILSQLKNRHNKHGDDDEVGSDEDDKMSLRQLRGWHRKRHDDDEVGSDSDDEVAIGELMHRRKSKKRKLNRYPYENSIQETVNFHSDEDGYFKANLSILKSKLPKSSEAKKRCFKKDGFPETVIPVKTEQVLVSGIPMELKEDSSMLSKIKAEVLEPEFSEVPMLPKEHSPVLLKVKHENPQTRSLGHKSNNDSFSCYSSINCHEESSSSEVSKIVSEAVENQHMTPMFVEELPCCTLNEISYEHLDYHYPNFCPKSCGDTHANDSKESFETEIDTQLHPHGSFSETISPTTDIDPDMHANQQGQSCSISDAIIINKTECTDLYDGDNICMREDEVACTNLGSHVSDAAHVNKVGCSNHYKGNETCASEVTKGLYSDQQSRSTVSPFKKCSSSGNSHSYSNTDNDLISVEETTTYEDPTNSCNGPGNDFIDKCQIVEKRLSPCMVGNEASTLKGQPCDLACMHSTSELQQLPERLLSKRKAISPSSQEQLCQAMNSADLPDELDSYKCEEKFLFGEYTESEHHSEHPHIVNSRIDENSKSSAQAKVFIGPNELAKRLKSRRKGSLHDSNLKGCDHSQLVHQFSTGCTSLQQFSASAIAFSELQMHDTKSLAMKLMNELKSMTDIVQGKLLSERCNRDLRQNEADEVRAAIKNANKVKVKARKLLSMMNRDCTRFCKLMKMSQDDAVPSKDMVHNKRKITFADEAGGMLCHVNYYSDPMPLKQSDDEKQEDQKLRR